MTISSQQNPVCKDYQSPKLNDLKKKLSNEQLQSFEAIYELLCFHNKYGIGESFILSAPGAETKSVTITSTIGEGGSKKTALLDDNSVMMLPNLDEDHFAGTARWWPEAVAKETAVADYLESINVPGLARKQAILLIPKSDNYEIKYKLPVMISPSFAQYAEKGWYISDSKNPGSSIYSEKALAKWNLELKTWSEVIKPLIKEFYVLSVNNFSVNGDARNFVLREVSDNKFELHYFGFDFGGKYGSKDVPTKSATIPQISKETICSVVPSSSIKYGLEDFFSNQLYKKYKCSWNQNKEVEKFITDASTYFSSCAFITEALGEVIKHGSEL